MNINLTYDPDATFIKAGLTATDITNMKAAMTYAELQFRGRNVLDIAPWNPLVWPRSSLLWDARRGSQVHDAPGFHRFDLLPMNTLSFPALWLRRSQRNIPSTR